MSQLRWLTCTLLCLTSAAACAGSADNWPHYANDLAASRYSDLDFINADNVENLEIVWRWSSRNFGSRPELKYRTTPIVIDGVVYATAGYRRAVVALDGATGETLWVYRLDEGRRTQSAPRLNSGRGVAYWADGDDRRLFMVTPAYQLVALRPADGSLIRSFGDEGIVDLKVGLGVALDIDEARIGSSSPPLIVGDIAVIGAAMDPGMRPPSKAHVPGHVRGFDVRTGKQKWIFHTIPRPGEFGHDTWHGDSWRYTGNTGVWAPMSADANRGLVYLPVEAATSDIYGGHRHGDNLFSSSLVCLDAATGERIWHYQIIHHDIWDWDNPTAPILVDIDVDGQAIPAVVQVTKQSFAYVFNRVTGEPVWPIEEKPVPQTQVPGEWTSPTQPHPSRPAPFDLQGVTVEDLIDFTPALREEALQLVADFRLGSLFSPPSLAEAADGTKGTLVVPGSLGGANWESGAIDARTGVLYVSSSTYPSVYALTSDPEYSDVDFVKTGRPPRVQGLPLLKPPYGRITAIDLNTGEHLWMIANGDTPESIRNHPALKGVELPRTGKATRAGLLVTKSLLFAGESWSGDPVFRAHDKNSGEIIAEIELPASQTGLPMTYAIDGAQYIVVAVGGNGVSGELVALSVRE